MVRLSLVRLSLIALSLIAVACGKVSSPGDGDGGPGDGDGGGGADANPITDLSVTLEVGTGGGSVVSDVGGIDCGSSCGATLDTGTEVTFTATPDEGSAFVAWRGVSARDCRRATECTVTMTGGPQEVGALFAEKGTAGWAIQIGSTVNDGGGQFVIDKNGDLLYAASYGALFEFAGESYENAGSSDIFLAKLSPGGEVIWARGLGGASSDGVAFIAADPTTGDVVLGGYYQAAIDLGGPEPLDIADTEDLFLAKFASADGSLIWQKPIEVSDNDGPGFEGLAVDSDGDIALTGHFNTSINLGAATLTSADQEMFLAKLKGSDGSVDWQKKLAGSAAIPNQLVVDTLGNVIVIGTYFDTVDFDGVAGNGNEMTVTGQRDAFIVKFASGNGSWLWNHRVGGGDDSSGGNDEGYGIALGPNNSVVVVIQYRVMPAESVTFLGNVLAGSGTGIDLVVGRISAAGSFIWARRYGGAGNEYGYRIATFQDGRVAVTGAFTADFDMNGHGLAFEGESSDRFFAVLAAASGNATYAARVGSPLIEYNASWVAGFDDQLYGGGQFQAEGTFLGKTLTSAGASDAYGFMVPLP